MDISNKKHFLTVIDYSVSKETFDLYYDQDLDLLITSPQPSPENLARLIELKPLAQKVRYDHSTYRKEAEEYSALIWHLYSVDGVTLYRLAKRLGVTHGALRFRLVRCGYLVPKTCKSACYTPIKENNRAVTQ